MTAAPFCAAGPWPPDVLPEEACMGRDDMLPI